jgi:ACS family tartrate transporter-like MFS transporter
VPHLSVEQQRLCVARVTRRLVPFAFLCYVVAYIDRVNIGFAATALQRDLGLTDTAYGIGAGLFFLGYCLFEIPSNLILARVGARVWMARIMIVWGVVSMATMFVTDVPTFYAARVLLGIAEAGFFPGMVLYLTFWIPAADRARTGALFMMAAPIAMILGAPLSEALLKLDGVFGLAGWQWLFLVEGSPAIVLGVLALKVFTNRPEEAAWLPERERHWLVETLARERAARGGV